MTRTVSWFLSVFPALPWAALGEFSIDATVPNPEVAFRLIGDDGAGIHELMLTRSQLIPKGE